MRLLRAGARTRSWLTVGTVAVGLLAGGAWLVEAQWVGGHSLLDDLTRRALAQEVPPPPQPPAVPKPTGVAATNSKRPTGEVVAINPEPASFTMRTPTGTVSSYRVLETTVFMAGRDRPYRFDLVKIGDTVVVRGGGQGKSHAAGGAGAPNGKGKPKPGRGAAVVVTGDGELIARQVMVRPAGEARGGNKGRATGVQNGGSDGAGE